MHKGVSQEMENAENNFFFFMESQWVCFSFHMSLASRCFNIVKDAYNTWNTFFFLLFPPTFLFLI